MIYLVTAGGNHEGSEVRAIKETKAEAEEFAKKQRDSRHNYDFVDVEEWEIGEER